MRSWVGLAVGVLVLAGGCSSSDEAPSAGTEESQAAPASSAAEPSESPEPEGEPETLDAAAAAAQEYVDRYTSNDFGGAYDLLKTSNQEAISREDWVRVAETCANTGLPIEVEGVRLKDDGSAVVRYVVGGFKDTRYVWYEDGTWLSSSDWADGTSADDSIAAAQADGSCRSTS